MYYKRLRLRHERDMNIIPLLGEPVLTLRRCSGLKALVEGGKGWVLKRDV